MGRIRRWQEKALAIARRAEEAKVRSPLSRHGILRTRPHVPVCELHPRTRARTHTCTDDDICVCT